MKNQGKMAICLESILLLTKNGFFFAINHKFDSKRVSYNGWITNFGDFFNVKSQIWSKKIIKSPFFANF
jgi:hypothetical protein